MYGRSNGCITRIALCILGFMVVGCLNIFSGSPEPSNPAPSSKAESSSTQAYDSKLTEFALPGNGKVLDGNSTGNAGYRITAPSGYSCYAKVISGGRTQVGFFIRSGSTATVSVPNGTYTVKFALGKKWYGKKERFGATTGYGQDSSKKSLSSGDVMTYTLQMTSNGNFSMGSLDASQF